MRVVDLSGRFLAWGHFSPSSRIRVRLLDWTEDSVIDDDWWRERLDEAVDRRRSLLDRSDTDACRLVFSESDFLPGLIVDRYAEALVLQALTPGMDRRKEFVAGYLSEKFNISEVHERSDPEGRRMEGLDPANGPLRGRAAEEPRYIREGGYRFRVDLASGQKTGFFLDQRCNRRRAAARAAGREVLDCFAYTAAFSVYAAGSGARSITRIESSAAAAALGDENMRLNGLEGYPGESIVGDAFHELRKMRDRGRSFDLIVLDPPKFAPTRSQASRAARGYKDINLLAFKLLNPGGVLVTFSCSQGIDPRLFEQIVFSAALDAGREAQILEWLSQDTDHPVRLSFPEARYLKGLICLAL